MRVVVVFGVIIVDIDRVGWDVFEQYGFRLNFFNYGGDWGLLFYLGVVCVSFNEMIVYGIFGEWEFKDGDIVFIDYGVIVDGWYGDVVWIVFVGDVSEEVWILFEVICELMWVGIVKVVFGVWIGDIFVVV